MGDPFDLTRLVDAQAGIYEQALQELTTGRKRSHWMWFLSPQIGGLGTSRMVLRNMLGDPVRGSRYLAHLFLKARLRARTAAANAITRRSAQERSGSPDDVKFLSSMTLFGRFDSAAAEFNLMLARFRSSVERNRHLRS